MTMMDATAIITTTASKRLLLACLPSYAIFTRVELKGLQPDRFRHPLDRQATEQVSSSCSSGRSSSCRSSSRSRSGNTITDGGGGSSSSSEVTMNTTAASSDVSP